MPSRNICGGVPFECTATSELPSVSANRSSSVWSFHFTEPGFTCPPSRTGTSYPFVPFASSSFGVRKKTTFLSSPPYSIQPKTAMIAAVPAIAHFLFGVIARMPRWRSDRPPARAHGARGGVSGARAPRIRRSRAMPRRTPQRRRSSWSPVWPAWSAPSQCDRLGGELGVPLEAGRFVPLADEVDHHEQERERVGAKEEHVERIHRRRARLYLVQRAPPAHREVHDRHVDRAEDPDGRAPLRAPNGLVDEGAQREIADEDQEEHERRREPRIPGPPHAQIGR